ncbi:olfactory receptor 2A12-like [Phyllostomus hastatus]|uniref:olfactory receptor 2A12-like n=1 Tax=Phyllostomus hastatus TaxID=9423 RepID=UPI001E685314|nr:olfactory receptor 2A12-like [Phyllostomus hastatus]
MGNNQTWITGVILLGFQVDPELEVFLFGFFLLFYSVTLLGNGVILGLICVDSHLHTPMYFFLSNLAIVDMSYASSTVPKMLANLMMHRKTIAFGACILQTSMYLIHAVTECTCLLVMSYDRYVAICHPLQYSVIMSWRVCTILAAMSWLFSFLLALVHITLLLRLPFCGPQKINHFFCPILPVFRLACADTRLNELVLFVGSVIVLVGPLCLVLVSYTRILWAILRIQSGEGCRKAFSTCSSHLRVVGIFFGCAIDIYLVPKSRHPKEQQDIPLLFTLFSPKVNQLIYSLRNADVKGALQRALCEESHFQLE